MKNNFRSFFLIVSLFFGVLPISADAAQTERRVEVKNDQLVVDENAQPQIFGAEVQYFRLRGGYGKNIPRAKVLALWNKALDRLVEAKMNAVSFYIPWDFHEYAEGKFDFTGEADEDGDGQPDYPSRDLVTFFKLVEAHGIHRIMVRPGPYINAEWGFLGFGAVPEWFHNKYPESHMKTSWGWSTRLYDYLSPEFLAHTKLWFKAVHEKVLKDYIGLGKPIFFLQLDNETNYQWQSIYDHDYGPRAIQRYQQFLKDTYHEMSALNLAHGRQWVHWTQVQPPTKPGLNLTEDQDWYRFADQTIFSYLHEIRFMWERLGVHEPQVLFTLAESYNAPLHGLVPNYVLRNSKDMTGLMTVNLYPKTSETSGHPVLNLPFKADLDVKSADEANDAYFGSRQEWVMGPEIQGGWWRGTTVSPEARQQTYLTVLGHGMKSFFIYYFNEGQNWDNDWSYRQIKPLFEDLKKERQVESIPADKLNNEFWGELQARADRNIMLGFDVRRLMQSDPRQDDELYFDAPLNGNADPRGHFDQLKAIGERVIAPYQDFLARSSEITDKVAMVKDSTNHVPSPMTGVLGAQASSDWSGGLLGYLMNSDINPRILMGDISPESAFSEMKVLIHLDTNVNSLRTELMLQQAPNRGVMVINYLGDQIAQNLGFHFFPEPILDSDINLERKLTFFLGPKGEFRTGTEPDAKPFQILAKGPLYKYNLKGAADSCSSFLYWQGEVVGYRCKVGQGSFLQIGSAFFKDYNSDLYAGIKDFSERKSLLKALVAEAHVQSQIQLSDEAARTVAFGRKDPQQKLLWVTVKTGTETPQSFKLKMGSDILFEGLKYSASEDTDCRALIYVKDLLQQKTQSLSVCELIENGFLINLPGSASRVFSIYR